MKKLIACMLALLLLFPAAALAKEATVGQSAPEDSTRTITVSGYLIVIVPPSKEGEELSIGIFTCDENGEAEEEMTSFTLGGTLGKSVSQLAKTVEPGPEHGKVVSTFVRTVNDEKKAAKRIEIEKRKADKQKSSREKADEEEEAEEITQDKADDEEADKASGGKESKEKGVKQKTGQGEKSGGKKSKK